MTIAPTPVIDPAVAEEKKAPRKGSKTGSEDKPKPAILVTVILGIISLAWLAPLVSMVITSFKTKAGADNVPWWDAIVNPFGQDWTFASYGEAFESLNVGQSFFNSLAVVIPATLLPIMIAAMGAYAFTFFNFRFKETYFAVILALLVVPVQAVIIPILQIFVAIRNTTGFQIVGTFPAAWMIHAAFAMPLAVYIFRNYMSTLPVSLIEAARVDGASHFLIFWRLIVPMSVPALASFAIFQFLWTWNDFFVAYVFIGDGPNAVLTQGLYQLLGQYGQGWQRVLAGGMIVIVVPLIMFFALQRYFVRGLTAGSVK